MEIRHSPETPEAYGKQSGSRRLRLTANSTNVLPPIFSTFNTWRKGGRDGNLLSDD
jgi:hypothetical protein